MFVHIRKMFTCKRNVELIRRGVHSGSLVVTHVGTTLVTVAIVYIVRSGMRTCIFYVGKGIFYVGKGIFNRRFV